jgi:hypothetical protein
MLRDLREFLQARGPSEAAAVARHLGTDVSAARGMLEFLEQRGQVRRIEMACGGGGCGGCGGCGSSRTQRMETEQTVIFWSAGMRTDLETGEAER